jgi:flagellar hook-length control protein FliK
LTAGNPPVVTAAQPANTTGRPALGAAQAVVAGANPSSTSSVLVNSTDEGPQSGDSSASALPSIAAAIAAATSDVEQVNAPDAQPVVPAKGPATNNQTATDKPADAPDQSGIPANSTPNPNPQTQPTAMTSPSTGNTASASSQRSQELVDRVENNLRTGFDTGGEMRVRLEPPALGKVQVEVTAASNGVTARLEVQTSAAQQTLLDNISMLHTAIATAIAQTGATVAHVEVVVVPHSQDGSPSDRQSSSNNQQQASSHGNSQGGSQNQPDTQKENQKWAGPSAIDQIDIEV